MASLHLGRSGLLAVCPVMEECEHDPEPTLVRISPQLNVVRATQIVALNGRNGQHGPLAVYHASLVSAYFLPTRENSGLRLH